MNELEAKAYLHVRQVVRAVMRQHQPVGCCWKALAGVLNELGDETMRASWVIDGDGDWDCADEKPDFSAEDH